MASSGALHASLTSYLPLLAGALGLASSGCGASMPTCPAKGGAPWHEVTSRHFVVQTDLREAEARAMGDDLERLYTLLDTVVFRGYRGSRDQTTVVIFAEKDELDAFSGDRLIGWYSDKSAVDLE